MKTIDLDKLSNVCGGVRPGPNGEGCTQGPFGPKRPRPTTPTLPGTTRATDLSE